MKLNRKSFIASLLGLLAAPFLKFVPKKKEIYYRSFIKQDLFGCEIKRLHPDDRIFVHACRITWRDERDTLNLEKDDVICYSILKGYNDLEGSINSISFGIFKGEDEGKITGCQIMNCTAVGKSVNENSTSVSCYSTGKGNYVYKTSSMDIGPVQVGKPGSFQGLPIAAGTLKIG